jgi:predicted short-subunit dehydrogenase-like oxidoreductase (DUF2520 family)
MKNIAIIGAGRLGTSLAFAMSKKGYTIKALSCRSKNSVEESRQKIGHGIPSTDNVQTADKGEIIFLTVPDDEIERVVKELESSPLDWEGKVVLHCSGLLTSKALDPLKSKGAYTASVHPCLSFPKKQNKHDIFQNIFFALEGDEIAVAVTKNIVNKIGALHFIIRSENKACYHTACSMASNMSVVLLYTAISLLSECGIGENEAKKVLWPLVEGTLHNVNKIDILSALTGPVARGDLTTIKKHLAELNKFPSSRQIYLDLAKQALEMAKRRNKVVGEKISAMEALLEHE